MENFTKTLKYFSIIILSVLFSFNLKAQNNTLDFDGIDDYVQIPHGSYAAKILSVQLSVKINSNNTLRQTVFTCGGISGGVYTGFSVYAGADNNWYVYYGDGTSTVGILNGGSITYGAWTNLAGTYDGSKIRFYVNGVPKDSATHTVSPNATFPIVLGASNPASAPLDSYFGGQIDELSLWRTPLTSSQIQFGLNHPLNPSDVNLLAYYNFNQGNANNPNPSVTTLIDNSGHLHTGTLNNFTLDGPTSNWVSSDLVLPLDLISFTGSNKNGQNNLQWATAMEQNTSHFDIQRSTNGVDFSNIGKVAAAGNSSNTKNYSYSDGDLSSLTSVYYYRLNMVDIDGASKYSPVIAVKNSNNAVSLKVFPNPTTDRFTITLKDNKLLNTKVSVSDLNGRVLQRISLNQSETRVNISNYVKGVYVLKFEDGNSIKVIKE